MPTLTDAPSVSSVAFIMAREMDADRLRPLAALTLTADARRAPLAYVRTFFA